MVVTLGVTPGTQDVLGFQKIARACIRKLDYSSIHEHDLWAVYGMVLGVKGSKVGFPSLPTNKQHCCCRHHTLCARIPKQSYRVPPVAPSVYFGGGGLCSQQNVQTHVRSFTSTQPSLGTTSRRRLVRHEPVHLLEIECHLRNPLRAAGDRVETGFV